MPVTVASCLVASNSPEDYPANDDAPPSEPRRIIRSHEAAHAVIRATCEGTDVKPDDIMSRCRKPRAVTLRSEVIKSLHYGLGWSHSAIGRFLKRDHTTVGYALRRAPRDFDSLPPMRRKSRSRPPVSDFEAPQPYDDETGVVLVDDTDTTVQLLANAAKGRRDPDAAPDPSKLTKVQEGCKAATERLLAELTGERGFGGVREKPQDRGPAWT
jgi:hypothetical protein